MAIADRTTVVLVTPRMEEADLWRQLLASRIPDLDFRAYPEIGDLARADVALAWKAPAGALVSLPGLGLICSLGMGVDHLLKDETLPRGVPIVRLVDANMVDQMSEYAVYAVLHFHRRFDVYERYQRERRWQELPLPHTARRRVGVMGLGAIGSDCARRIAAFGFQVSGWSRTPKSIDGVACLHGDAALADFLASAEILVVTLPLTRATAGILNARTFAQLPRGASVVNLARGGLIDEGDLVDALDAGQLSGAFLDVTQHEPLPQESPLWSHARVKLTPHIAGLTNPETAVEPIAENIRRWRAGLPLNDLVDLRLGY